ncbi:tRNA (adenosine(37)-N6)-dimethylallyltransferase MiaA [Mesorhizobium sp. YIM 152430]|uniref:tRNA (adenosine(37)-N6)-dimethylallyltransferase MiaA n=1 Tax=Mesorhizobium sp. YIM 152430 TaxID=3031761 RepID=UPI0023DBB79D|nr:tRNA (adenosine(37)-N6)-dimethylallyltransferase MiaA [Mesorhizobium sp. YIM 152430]MDF1598323.1 tRNA (adenosine(37)-N6)-dimethylallyltransferase MiaA [Mesorhizobium sp. YIM 152430]
MRNQDGDERHGGLSERKRSVLKNAVLIAGPTASGKSRLAIRIAEAAGGIVVNADSMQVYDVLRVITARPMPDEEARVPHRLFGHVDPAIAYSVAKWLADVDALVKSPEAARKLIFVGGTGLYFRALTEGISQMPDIPPAIRKKWRQALLDAGAEALHRELGALDPRAAERLRPSDGQRIVRALEVVEASGRSILDWQGDRSQPPVDAQSARKIVLAPGRDFLRDMIDRRFDGMIASGALDEVRAILALDLAPSLPARKAIGVPELAAFLSGEASLDDAIARAKLATKQYAKRQETWFRNQFGPDWERVQPDRGKS